VKATQSSGKLYSTKNLHDLTIKALAAIITFYYAGWFMQRAPEKDL
jgi:hypothetical protein